LLSEESNVPSPHAVQGESVLCRRAFALILPLLAAVAFGTPSIAEDPGFVVVVSLDVPGTQIPRDVLSSIFLGESPRWGDGRPVHPVDQSLRSAVRRTFSERVHRKPLEGIEALWHRKLIAGVRPPKVKPSDAEVIAFVSEKKGAIGYVTPSVPLPDTVKVVTIAD
jgi:ABC-type phosphate transport system substrate-binding protein